MTEDPEVPDEASAAEIEIDSVETEETSAQEKCTKQYVLTVEKNVKYLSSQVMARMETHDQSIVEIAIKTTRNTKTVNF